MILSLVAILVVLILAFWLLTMYASWKQHQGVLKAIDEHEIRYRTEQALRLVRRTTYTGMRYFNTGLNWGLAHVRKGFYTLFPKAQSAFVKHDELMGLKTGPSSYFLHTISESKKEAPKTTRRKKVV
jgi:hypothetical protein